MRTRAIAPAVIKFRKSTDKYLKHLKISADIDDLTIGGHKYIMINFDTRQANKAGFNLDGIQILYTKEGFELSEYQAGENQNELHVFGNYRTINAALHRMLKGKKTPIQIWN